MGFSPFNSFRYAIFQITSVMTATGFASTDFNMWKDSAKILVLSVMFIGGCAGSTGGGMKVVRFLLMLNMQGENSSNLFILDSSGLFG